MNMNNPVLMFLSVDDGKSGFYREPQNKELIKNVYGRIDTGQIIMRCLTLMDGCYIQINNFTLIFRRSGPTSNNSTKITHDFVIANSSCNNGLDLFLLFKQFTSAFSTFLI